VLPCFGCRPLRPLAEAGNPTDPSGRPSLDPEELAPHAARRPPAPKTVKICLAAAVALVVLSIAGASLARNGGRGTEAAGGGEQPCGTTVTSGSGADGTVGFTPCPGDRPPAPHPQVVEPTPGMADVHARPYDSATIGDDGVTVTIDFVSGVEPCSVLDHVDVAYGVSTVTITLFEGHDPNAGQIACIDIGVFKRVEIVLDQPLGDRKLVDGGA
jgi:hypothetical protein